MAISKYSKLIKTKEDKERVKSILSMSAETIRFIEEIDKERFPSQVMKEYYEVIQELLTAICLSDGYKTSGEGAHMQLIKHLERNYLEYNEDEIKLIDDLRVIRNKISYEGFFVKKKFIKRKEKEIKRIITKLRRTTINKTE